MSVLSSGYFLSFSLSKNSDDRLRLFLLGYLASLMFRQESGEPRLLRGFLFFVSSFMTGIAPIGAVFLGGGSFYVMILLFGDLLS